MTTKRKGSSKKNEKQEASSSDNAPFVDQPILGDQTPESSPKSKSCSSRAKKSKRAEEESGFIGKAVPDAEARKRWPHRYLPKNDNHSLGSNTKTPPLKDATEEKIQARAHYLKAEVDAKIIFNLGDDAYVKGEDGQDDYICRIVEMFEGLDDGKPYFTAQWFYRAKDTVIKDCCNLIDNKRVFLSQVKDDNPLDCLVSKLKIVRLPLDVNSTFKKDKISDCDYYYDMLYFLPYSSFINLPPDNVRDAGEPDAAISSWDSVPEVGERKEMTLLDLYSGCGGMSTGLCLGANMSDVNLITKWAVDLNKYACESLKLNHPETEVRNESVEDFLSLLKAWKKLCDSFGLIGCKDPKQQFVDPASVEDKVDDEEENNDHEENGDEIFEVEKVLSICYGDPNDTKKPEVHLKIRWKGYGPDEDTWEPIEGLSDCQEKIKEFVTIGYNSRILPLPGHVDVVCGGPPCQGISGFNRFRNKDNPLDDPKNKQLVVYMDVVDYLQPNFVLMENVVDIVKFAGGFLGRYALARLVGMNYQARIGMMAAGAYGLPQFRMRMFMWGARAVEKLPQYPLPTHNVVVRGGTPVEFESNAVAYDEGHKQELEKELRLEDAISDLPSVENNEARDEIPYSNGPKTEFQKLIRLKKSEIPGFSGSEHQHVLFDHRPLQLNEDDYQRVCQIPKRKGANFRDLKGVRVRDDNRVEWDPNVERVYLPSGKPLVPDYAMSFVEGRSQKPFGRLWWDETVPTVVTRAEPHNQVILHPQQNRVLSIRENARLQGFPDYYKLLGPIKERYMQVGNAVAVPVARALGYALALASKGCSCEEPLLTLPSKFPKRPHLSNGVHLSK